MEQSRVRVTVTGKVQGVGFRAACRDQARAARDAIAAEAITPYPPGIPLVMPGERLNADVLALLTALRKAGNPMSASDPTLEFVTTVC